MGLLALVGSPPFCYSRSRANNIVRSALAPSVGSGCIRQRRKSPVVSLTQPFKIVEQLKDDEARIGRQGARLHQKEWEVRRAFSSESSQWHADGQLQHQGQCEPVQRQTRHQKSHSLSSFAKRGIH